MKKFILPIGILIFILIALGVTLFLVKQRQELRKKAAPATVLSFSPATTTKQVGDTFSLSVSIDTGENSISAAELHINYPAATLEGVSIAPGSFLMKNLQPGGPVIGNGSATIILGTDTTNPASGQGVLAVLTFKVIAQSALPIKVTIDPASQAAAFGEGGNVISSMENATITIGGNPTASPTVTNQPTITFTPTPTTVDDEEGEEETPTPTPTDTEEEQDENVTATPTSTPTPTTTQTSFNDDEETSDSETALTILNPTEGQIITSSKPVIKGKAKPGAKIVITIQSEPQTITVTADENGNWQITPEQPLENGDHTLIVQANGDEISTDFTVGLPETATFAPTLVFVLAGGVLLILGFFRFLTI